MRGAAAGGDPQPQPTHQRGAAEGGPGGCDGHGTAEARFAAGESAYASGDVSTAFACFVGATRLSPRMAEAWYMAGGMHVVVGQGTEAVPLLERAVAIEPTHPHALFELANVHLERRSAATAAPLYQRSASSFEALLSAGHPEKATLLPTVLSNLGNALTDLRRLGEAGDSYRRATLAAPPSCLAYNGLSNWCEGAQRFDEARTASMQAIQLLPHCDLAYYNLGRLLRAAERNMEAPVAFAAASSLKPSNSLYVNGLGTALHAAGRAAEARAAYMVALRIAPQWSSPYRNLGLLDVEAGGRAREALGWFEATVALEPTSAETYTDMGTARLELGELDAAMAEYRTSLSLNPSNALAHANYVYLATKLCKWRHFERAHARLRTLNADLLTQLDARRANPMVPAPHLFLPPYHALSYEGYSPSTLLAQAGAYAERAAERVGALAPMSHREASLVRSPPPPQRADARIVVGYLSTDFGEHPTSHLMRSVWRLQRERRTVRAVCFARSDDRSEQRAHIAATCEEFVELTGLSWRDAAERIRQRRVMILVDLNGHCGRPQFEILALRPAPVQLTYMGHPGTSGADYVQYALVDPLTSPPQARRHFSEHLLSLHQWHVTDYRFAHAFDTLGAPPEHAPKIGTRRRWPVGASRSELGLPPRAARATSPQHGASPGFVFGTFSQLYKVTPRQYQTWLNALGSSPPHSRLWLLMFPDIAARNLVRHAAAAGIHTARLLAAPTASRTFHLARVSLADVLLDTAPYGGHTTTGDALWMGTPVLSTPGSMMQSRVTASYATNAGCPQTIARSLRSLQAMATALASDPERAASLRRCLERGRWTRAAFDTERWVDAFDRGAHAIWEVHRYGLRGMHIKLPASHAAGLA